MEIKNIVFDFGGVLMDWNPVYLYRDIFVKKEELDFFLKNVCNDEWNQQQDAGRPFQEAIDELIPHFPEYKHHIEWYFTHWIKMIAGEIKENTAVLKGLKGHYRLFGLTNWSAETFPLVYNQYSFFQDFEGIVVSGKEKLIKPDARIYQLLLSRYDLKAEQCLFIDDNKKNIDKARELGFQVIHLADGVNLSEEVKKLGLEMS